MSLFGLGDITFNKNNTKGFGPLSALEGTKFEQNTFRYPIDIGNYDKGHYMVFYIREQSETQFKGAQAGEYDIPVQAKGGNISNISTQFGGIVNGKIQNGLDQINSATGGSLSQIKNLASNSIGGVLDKVKSGIGNIFGQSKIFKGNSESTQAIIDTSIKKISKKGLVSQLRKTNLTTDAVALYMPDTLMFTHSQEYSGLTPGKELIGQAATAAGQSILGKDFDIGQLKGIATQKGAEFISKLTGGQATAQLGAFAATGGVVNPMLELLYSSPAFRTFQFDFAFYPRDEKEAMEVQKIIERFRFHQAPEIQTTASGLQTGLLIPPSEFDIKFYYGGSQNPNIPPIGTCVLTTIDVNYAPNGFSAYEIPGELEASRGRTGMPTAINLTLQFQETTYLTKEDFRDDREDGFKRY